jgi:vancomycin resistance protein YoaR
VKPKVPALPQQAALVPPPVPGLPQQAALVPPIPPMQPQPTAVMPQVPALPVSGGPLPPANGLVPPPIGMVPPPMDTGVTLGDDTSDFTLTDVTFTDIGGNGLLLWLRGLKARLSRGGPRAPKATAGAAGAPFAQRKHWGLRTWQWVLIGGGTVVLLFVGFVAIDGGLYYNKVHPGVKVAGQSLSGMDSDKAAATLATFVDEAKKRPITLTSADESWEVLPSDVGTTIDVQAAVSAAMALTRAGDPFSDLGKKLKLYFGSDDIPLAGTVDSAKVDALLTKIAKELDVPATNAHLVIENGKIEVAEGEQGSTVDKEALLASLTKLLFTFHSTELPIPMVVTLPEVAAVDISPALGSANVMIASDLVLTHEGKTLVTIVPRDIATYMDLVNQENNGVTTTVPALSVDKMKAFFDTIKKTVDKPGLNATMDSDGDKVWVVEGEDGKGLDRAATAAALTQAALKTTGRTAEVVLTTVPPELTGDEVRAMGIKDKLSSYATAPFAGSLGRRANVRLATSLCSGVLLAPGEEFNTDKRLGIRDKAHGWELAPGIVGGGELDDVYGGGICQVSTTLFNAVYWAGLEIVERHNHSLYIGHYPDGLDATVTGGGKNMRFRNDTKNYIFIYGWSSGMNTRFTIWGVDDGRKVTHKFSGFYGYHGFQTKTILNPLLKAGYKKEVYAGQQGMTCSVTRTVTYADGTTKTQKWISVWKTIDRVIEMGPTTAPPGSTTTTPGPTDPPITEPPATDPPTPTTL